MVREMSEGIPRTSFHNARNRIHSVVYNVVEQVMLDLTRKDVHGGMLDAHVARFFDTDAVTEVILNRLLASSSIMETIKTFLSRKTENERDEEKYIFTCTSKKPIDTEKMEKTVETHYRADLTPGAGKYPNKKASKRCSKRCDSKQRSKAVKRHSSSFEL